MPELPSLEIITTYAGRSKVGDHALAVRHRRRRAMWIGLMRLVLLPVADTGLPEHLAGRAVKAYHRAAILSLDRLGEKNTIAPDDGRGIAGIGQRNLPAYVF